MRLDTPNMKQSAYDRERTLTHRHQDATIGGTLVVLGAIAAALLVWYLAYAPAGAPKGSTSTSAKVDPADTVGPKAKPKPGVDPDGR